MDKKDYEDEFEKDKLEIPEELKNRSDLRKAVEDGVFDKHLAYLDAEGIAKLLVEKMRKETPQNVNVLNQIKEIIAKVDFPETQKVEVANQIEKIVAEVKFPDIQKVSLTEKVIAKITNLPSIQKIAGSVTVDNLPETQQVHVNNPVEKMEVSGLEKLLQGRQLPTASTDNQGNLQKGSAPPNRFLNVRMTDGKNFLGQALTSAFNTAFRPFVNSLGRNQPALVDDATGRIQADVTTTSGNLSYGRILDASNSSTSNLGIDEVFTGGWVDTLEAASVIVQVLTDEDSATDGLEVQMSSDASTVHHNHQFSVPDNSPLGSHYVFTLTCQYYRIVYTNGSTGQSSFNLCSSLSRYDATHSHTHPVEFPIDGNHEAQLMRAVLTAKKPNGDYTNIQATAGGNLKSSIEEFDESAILPGIGGTTAVSGTFTSTVSVYRKLITYSGSLAIYIGEAATGTLKSAELWRIKKVTYAGSNAIDISWADGVGTFTKEWDERTTYDYDPDS